VKKIENENTKNKRERFLTDLLYFVTVLALAGVFLSAWVELRPEQIFEQREVAKHTAGLLGLFGLKAEVYEWSVKIPNENVQQKAIVEKLMVFGFKASEYKAGIALKVKSLNRDDERIAELYLLELMRQGLPLYVSKAMIAIDISTEVDIVPECVGWLGLFAVCALILAYPRVPWRKRAIGWLIALPLMYLMNLVRLSTSTYVAWTAGLPAFDFTHDLLWKSSLILWALFIWLVWIFYIVKANKSPTETKTKSI
jgi:exosortase/archaeosortase family protein